MNRKLIQQGMATLTLAAVMTISNGLAANAHAATAATVDHGVTYTETVTTIALVAPQQGDEKARAKAKKRYEREQKKIAKRARVMEKQKARIVKMDKKIQKMKNDLDKQGVRVANLERDLERAINRSSTSDVQVSKIEVNLRKAQLKYSRLENKLLKQQNKLNKALRKVGK